MNYNLYGFKLLIPDFRYENPCREDYDARL